MVSKSGPRNQKQPAHVFQHCRGPSIVFLAARFEATCLIVYTGSIGVNGGAPSAGAGLGCQRPSRCSIGPTPQHHNPPKTTKCAHASADLHLHVSNASAYSHGFVARCNCTCFCDIRLCCPMQFQWAASIHKCMSYFVSTDGHN